MQILGDPIGTIPWDVAAALIVGQYTPWIMVAVGVVIGIAVSFVPRPWGRKPRPTATA